MQLFSSNLVALCVLLVCTSAGLPQEATDKSLAEIFDGPSGLARIGLTPLRRAQGIVTSGRASSLPNSGLINLPSPHAGDRMPSWPDLEQTLASQRRMRKIWGLNETGLSSFYEELTAPKTTHSKDIAQHIKHLERWQAEIPTSASARVVTAKAYIDYAWEARGTGWGYTVTPEGGRHFAERIAIAHKLLDEAVRLGVEDGEAYRSYMTIAQAEGLDKEQAFAWLEAGRKLDPTYYGMYTGMATYLLPRWHGEPGDIERFAAEVVNWLPGDNGLDSYARIAFAIQQYECPYGDTLFHGEYDPKLLVRAAEVYLHRYSDSPAVSHFAALCTMVAQDHAAAKRIRPLVGPYDEAHRIWPWANSYKTFLMWSALPDVPAGEQKRVWGSLQGCVGIAFDDDNQHLWCAERFGNTSAKLVNVRTNDVMIKLPPSGSYLNAMAVDAERHRVLYSFSDQKQSGWTLYDLSDLPIPVTHKTEKRCEAIALDPKRPIVYWAEGTTIRSWNIEQDEGGRDVSFKSVPSDIKLSPAGKFMGLSTNWLIVCDPETLEVKFEFPPQGKQGSSPVHFQKLLSIDDDGRTWIAVTRSLPKGVKSVLMRLSADGSGTETLLEADEHWSSACLSPDRRLLATTSPTRANQFSPIDIWDATTGKRLKRLEGHWSSIKNLAFSADGKKLASLATWDDIVKIWSLSNLGD